MNKKIILYLVGAQVAMFVLAYAVYAGRLCAAWLEFVAIVNFIINTIKEVKK